VIVNFAERGVDEPMVTPPSIGKSLRLILDSELLQFGEVVSDFEGEADTNQMTLGMKMWEWQKADDNEGHIITPEKPDTFTLTFLNDGSVSVGTDCNSVGGEYVAENDDLEFTDIRTTLMYCEGSQETEFLKLLQQTQSFHFTSRGELILDLSDDSGTLTFR
jgi:heat shock protein HslJ